MTLPTRRSIGAHSIACFQATDHVVSRQWANALFSAGAHGILYSSARSDGTEGHEGRKEMGRPTRRDRSNIAVARFLDMPRRIAQERVPTASNVGSRDVTWASQPTPLIPFRVFSRVSRAPFLRQSEVVTGTQFLISSRPS